MTLSPETSVEVRKLVEVDVRETVDVTVEAGSVE